jgi:hypothetical protein
MIRHFILIVFSLLFVVDSAYSQLVKSDIVFEKSFHDFGSIFVENGIVTAKYKFTNNGSEDFIIVNVDAACGCTNPRSSKDTVAPGESGIISAEFNPKGMLGNVKKWIYVQSRFKDAYQIELHFEANIKSLTNRNKGEYHRGEFGYLLVDRTDLLWGDKFHNAVFRDSLVLTNDGYDDIIVKKIQEVPNFITSPNLPLTIKAGESKAMYIDVDTRLVDTIGQYFENMKIITTDRFFKKKSINYGINFKDDFASWKRKDLRKAAHINLNKSVIDMGNMKSGEIKNLPITISNTGKTPLLIRRIESDCSCALLKLKTRAIAPGESLKVYVKFDALFKEGNQTKIISVYTNDPNMPIQAIQVKAVVK